MAEVVKTCRKMYLWPTNYCTSWLALFGKKKNKSVNYLMPWNVQFSRLPSFFLSLLFSWLFLVYAFLRNLLLPLHFFWHVRRIAKATISLSCVLVSLSVRMEQLGSHRWIWKFDIWIFFFQALNLLVESFGLLNDLFPLPSILDAGYPVFDLYLADVLFDVILPSVLGSSLWSFG